LNTCFDVFDVEIFFQSLHHHHVQDLTSPALQPQLGALLQELQEVRMGAAAVAAAASRSRSLPQCPRFLGNAMPDQLMPFQQDAQHQQAPLPFFPHPAADLDAVIGGRVYSGGADSIGTPALPVPMGTGDGGFPTPSPQLPLPGSLAASGQCWDQPYEVSGATSSGNPSLGSAASSSLGTFGSGPNIGIGDAWAPRAAGHYTHGWSPAVPRTGPHLRYTGGALMAHEARGPTHEPLDRAPQGAIIRPMRTKIPRQEAHR